MVRKTIVLEQTQTEEKKKTVALYVFFIAFV